MNSYNTDIIFSNYYNLQSVHFEFRISLARHRVHLVQYEHSYIIVSYDMNESIL